LTPSPAAWLGSLAGTWRLERIIHDRRSRLSGWVTGAAVLRPVSGGLLYEETGMLRFGTHSGPTAQRYRFLLRGERAVEVCFADGRRFHDIVSFSDGDASVTHDCPPDRYRGRYRVRERDRWTLAWCIEGPRKRMLIGTRFSRLTR
jgi:hypothetical protein